MPWKIRGRRRRADPGRLGERAAARWLRRRGYRVVNRNLRIGRDEADLIVLDPAGTTLIVVEVKTRTRPGADPAARIDHHKRTCLARLAARLRQRPEHRDRAVRFDVVTVEWPPGARPVIRHIEAAFDSPF